MREQLYIRILQLLPEDFRAEYGDEMSRVVTDHWRAKAQKASSLGRALFWIRQILAVLRLSVQLKLGLEPTGYTSGRRNKTRGAGMMLSGLGQDLKQATRTLIKQPGFTLVTVATLALGIGASTAIFSAVHAVLFRDLVYQGPDRIVAIFHENTETLLRSTGASAANIADLRDENELLSGAAVAEPWSLDLLADGKTISLRTWAVSQGFFEVLGASPVLGRAFLPEEYAEGRDKVVLLGYGTWRGRFGSDPGVVGTTATFEGEAYTIVGVLPRDFKYPDAASAWIPRPDKESDISSRAADYMAGVARLGPGVTLAQAQSRTDRLASSLADLYPQTSATTGLRLVPFREHLFGDIQAPLIVLLSAVGVVLLIACANVTGLLLARGARRQREYALRSALGAGRGRLAQYVVSESLILAAAGCALGIAIALFGVRAIQALGPDHLPRIDELRVDGVVLAFAVVAGGLSALLAGIAPAFKLSKPQLHSTLADGSRGSTEGRPAGRLRDRLVVLEVGAALVLLIGAGLLGKSFTVLVNGELGFDPTNRVAVQTFAYGYPPGERVVFVNQAMDNMKALPGVRDVALTSNLPSATDATIASIDIDLPFRIDGEAAPAPGQAPNAWIAQVTSNYFDLMEIDVVSGRPFSENDRSETAPVVIVNETLARRHFGGADPVGQRIGLPWGSRDNLWQMREIVGIVKDVRPLGFESEPRPEVYFPLNQVGSGSLTFLIVTDSDASALVTPSMEAVWQANPAQAIWGATTVETLLGDWLKERRFNLMLLASFAAIALLLSAIGIYGLVSFSVEQRVAELGIRRALGGQTRDVLGMVLREGTGLAVAGVALGVLGSLGLTRFLSGMLFEVDAIDWQTFGLLTLAVLAVSALATLVPAVRATRVDPMEALREG